MATHCYCHLPASLCSCDENFTPEGFAIVRTFNTNDIFAKEQAEKRRLAEEQAEKRRLVEEQFEKCRLEKAMAEKGAPEGYLWYLNCIEKEGRKKPSNAYLWYSERSKQDRLAKKQAEKDRLAKEEAEKEQARKKKYLSHNERAEKYRLTQEQAKKRRLDELEARDDEKFVGIWATRFSHSEWKQYPDQILNPIQNKDKYFQDLMGECEDFLNKNIKDVINRSMKEDKDFFTIESDKKYKVRYATNCLEMMGYKLIEDVHREQFGGYISKMSLYECTREDLIR